MYVAWNKEVVRVDGHHGIPFKLEEVANVRLGQALRVKSQLELGKNLEKSGFDNAQNYYSFTTIAPFEACRPERRVVGTS